MRIFKNKTFTRWAAKEGLNDEALIQAVDEIEQGLVDANLGGHVYKKRVALPGRGKSAGVRTVLAYQTGEKVFFIYGFAKNTRANIDANELKALKMLAKVLLAYSDQELDQAVAKDVLSEVNRL